MVDQMTLESGNGPRDTILGPNSRSQLGGPTAHAEIGCGDPKGRRQRIRVEPLARDWPRARA